jgi:hypothetical protein
MEVILTILIMKEMIYMKTNMEKGYVESTVKEMVKKRKSIITKTELSNLSDSILFDWNELGDPEADFEDLVDWNVDQFLTHTASSNSMKRISMNEARESDLKVFKFDDYPAYSKEEPKAFTLGNKDANGFQKVTYWICWFGVFFI